MRVFGLALIALVPFWPLRRLLYHGVFGFEFGRGAKIGMFSLVDVRSLEMQEGSRIRGFGNIFLSVHALKMGAYSRIGSPRAGLNLFAGTYGRPGVPACTLTLGPCTFVTILHYFDLWGDVTFGANCVVGGVRSSFFTHTLYLSVYEPIAVGDNVYLASNCLFQMGTSIADNSVVGLGSVVVSRIEEPDVLVAGSPARVIRSHYQYNACEALALRSLPYFDGQSVIQPPPH